MDLNMHVNVITEAWMICFNNTVPQIPQNTSVFSSWFPIAFPSIAFIKLLPQQIQTDNNNIENKPNESDSILLLAITNYHFGKSHARSYCEMS